jgi:hypothetical protein
MSDESTTREDTETIHNKLNRAWALTEQVNQILATIATQQNLDPAGRRRLGDLIAASASLVEEIATLRNGGGIER